MFMFRIAALRLFGYQGGMMSALSVLLDRFKPSNEVEAAHVQQLRSFLAESPNPYDRSNLVAHTVADAWVVTPDRQQVLLLVHGASGEWLAPGGHTDGSPDMLTAALRELEEETGITPGQCRPLLDGGLFDLNVGFVPTRQKPHGLEPGHLHFDICFAFEAPDTVALKISHESLDLGWKPVHTALELVMPEHRRRVEKTLAGVI